MHEIIIGALAWLGIDLAGRCEGGVGMVVRFGIGNLCVVEHREEMEKDGESSLDVSVMDCLVAVEWFPARPRVSDVIAI